ncbi:MAG: hypothetical protein U5L11_12860 [Arhodomonas sp.]|nr:hypothetical protein [Arhodomonas sp.]
MFRSFLHGISFVARGFSLLTEPGLRRFVVAPLLINVVIFIGLFWLGAEYCALLDWLLPRPAAFGDGWLGETVQAIVTVIRWLLWPLFLLAGSVARCTPSRRWPTWSRRPLQRHAPRRGWSSAPPVACPPMSAGGAWWWRPPAPLPTSYARSRISPCWRCRFWCCSSSPWSMCWPRRCGRPIAPGSWRWSTATTHSAITGWLSPNSAGCCAVARPCTWAWAPACWP